MKFELGDAGVDEVLSTIQTKADEIFAKIKKEQQATGFHGLLY